MIWTPFCRFQLGFRTVEFNPSKGRGFLTEGVDRDGQTRGQARKRPKGGDGPRATRATGVSNCLHTPVQLQLRASRVGTPLSRIAQAFPLRVLNLPRDPP